MFDIAYGRWMSIRRHDGLHATLRVGNVNYLLNKNDPQCSEEIITRRIIELLPGNSAWKL